MSYQNKIGKELQFLSSLNKTEKIELEKLSNGILKRIELNECSEKDYLIKIDFLIDRMNKRIERKYNV